MSSFERTKISDMKTQKKNTWLLLLLMGVSTLGFAQNVTKETYRIKTIKIDNGNKWVLDTTFDSKEAMDAYMSTMDVEMPDVEDHNNKVIVRHIEDMDIDMDSLREELDKLEEVIEYNITELKDLDMNEVMVEIEDAQMEVADVQVLLEEHEGQLEQLSIDLDSILKAEGIKNGQAHVRVVMLKDSSKDAVVVKKRKRSKKIEKASGAKNMVMDMQPNPSQGGVTINLDAKDDGDFNPNGAVDIHIVTITGELVKKHHMYMNGGSVNVSTEGLAKGTYIVQVASQGRYVGKKLIVE
jgi:hypothetical protein